MGKPWHVVGTGRRRACQTYIALVEQKDRRTNWPRNVDSMDNFDGKSMARSIIVKKKCQKSPLTCSANLDPQKHPPTLEQFWSLEAPLTRASSSSFWRKRPRPRPGLRPGPRPERKTRREAGQGAGGNDFDIEEVHYKLAGDNTASGDASGSGKTHPHPQPWPTQRRTRLT